MPLLGPDGKPLSTQSVNEFHRYDDVDDSIFAHHHTLGDKRTQAAPGNHLHDDQLLQATGIEGIASWDANGADFANMGPQVHFVGTQQSSSSTAYTDLATVGPIVLLTAGPSGSVMCFWEAAMRQDSAATPGTGVWASLSVVKTSDSSVVQTPTDSVALETTDTSFETKTYFMPYTGLTPGEQYQFTMKYRTSAGAGGIVYAQNRRLVVWNTL